MFLLIHYFLSLKIRGEVTQVLPFTAAREKKKNMQTNGEISTFTTVSMQLQASRSEVV